jgi:hypothetical protein
MNIINATHGLCSLPYLPLNDVNIELIIVFDKYRIDNEKKL